MSEKLIWRRLKTMRCPKCNGNLVAVPHGSAYDCNAKTCDFRISGIKFEEIANSLYTKKNVDYPDNQEALNNL